MKSAGLEYLLDSRGKKKAVIVPLAEYRRMMEDLHDLAVVADRQSGENLSMTKMERKLTRRRLISAIP